MEDSLPWETRSDVVLWSILCQLLITTPKGEFSGSLLLPLEGVYTTVLTAEGKCSPRSFQRQMACGNSCYSAHGLHLLLGWDRLRVVFGTDWLLSPIHFPSN
jgi:hypothetical protein